MPISFKKNIYIYIYKPYCGTCGRHYRPFSLKKKTKKKKKEKKKRAPLYIYSPDKTNSWANKAK